MEVQKAPFVWPELNTRGRVANAQVAQRGGESVCWKEAEAPRPSPLVTVLCAHPPIPQHEVARCEQRHRSDMIKQRVSRRVNERVRVLQRRQGLTTQLEGCTVKLKGDVAWQDVTRGRMHQHPMKVELRRAVPESDGLSESLCEVGSMLRFMSPPARVLELAHRPAEFGERHDDVRV
jgi:hypothetical protein